MAAQARSPEVGAGRYEARARAARREALAAIVALGGGPATGADTPPAPMLWRLTLGSEGRVANLAAFEPGATARARPKPVSLAQLKKRARLEACDAEIERRDSLRIVRESPEHARLIRSSATQRRLAELVAKRRSVPVDAQAELDATLRVPSGHFVLHSDAQAGEPVASDARPLTQLLPRGDAIELRLVVRPSGDFGPVLVPGKARSRLMTMHQGISLATLRDRDAERAHFNAVLEALPFLGEAPPDASWLLDDPEQALAAVQTLGRMCAADEAGRSPGLPAARSEQLTTGASLPTTAGGADTPVRALEWLRGKPLRVIDVGAGSMKLALRSGRDGFMLDGEIAPDEQRVLSLQRPLGLLRDAGSQRFIALGEGRYLALAEQLRQRLAELDALAEADGVGVKLAAAARASCSSSA